MHKSSPKKQIINKEDENKGAEEKCRGGLSIPNAASNSDMSQSGRVPVTVENYKKLGSSPAVNFLSQFMHGSSSSSSSFSSPHPQLDHRQRGKGVGCGREGDIIATERGDLVIGRLIGRGAFSECRTGFLIESKSSVNVKIVSKKWIEEEETDDSEDRVKDKWKIWQTLTHPNILPLEQIITCDEEDGHFYLITPLASETLLTKLQRNGSFSEHEAKNLFKQLVAAVKYLHEVRNLTHGDIKLENILLKYEKNEEEEIKCWLTDFDFICPIGEMSERTQSNTLHHHRSGSLPYIPPVSTLQLSNQQLGGRPEDDIWALGVVLYAMIFGELPKPSHEIVSDIIIITDNNESYHHIQSLGNQSPIDSLLKGLLEPNPKKRLTIGQIIKHPWLTDQ